MRRTLAAALIATVATVGLGSITSAASAVCGGGQPGEPCYCPGGITIKDKEIVVIYC